MVDFGFFSPAGGRMEASGRAGDISALDTCCRTIGMKGNGKPDMQGKTATTRTKDGVVTNSYMVEEEEDKTHRSS